MDNIPNTRIRKLRTLIPGPKLAEFKVDKTSESNPSLIDLSSNDYLGLSRNQEIIQAVNSTIIEDGVGAGSSRLVTGSRPIHKELENSLENWLDVGQVLLFPSGFQANMAAVMALADRHTTVIADRLIHYSLLMGVKSSGARLQRFKHNSLSDLERLLKLCLKNGSKKKPLVLTESLFSMEGSSPNLNEMAALCEDYGAMLFVDEAHSLGIMGFEGKGLSYGVSAPIKMISGTFGKAFGSGGAFLATDKPTGEHLIQSSGFFRYTTALAPALAGAALKALNLIKENPYWGRQLIDKSAVWRKSLIKNGWECPEGTGPILSIILGSDQRALSHQNQLEREGLLCIAIRPPTVPEGTSRLRVVIRKDIPEGTLERFLTALSH